MNDATTTRARSMVLRSIVRFPATEAYLFAEAAQCGIPAHVLNTVIGQLVEECVVIEDTIETPPWPFGCGSVDMLRFAR